MVKCETKRKGSSYTYPAHQWSGSKYILCPEWQKRDWPICGGDLRITHRLGSGGLSLRCGKCGYGSTSNIKELNKVHKEILQLRDFTHRFENIEVPEEKEIKRAIKL